MRRLLPLPLLPYPPPRTLRPHVSSRAYTTSTPALDYSSLNNPPKISLSLITGGTRGIGLSIAHRLAAIGSRCILVGRDSSRLDAAVRNINQQAAESTTTSSTALVDPATGWQGDVGDWSWWEERRKDLKDVDLLVNAAGIAQASLLIPMRADAVEDVVRSNLLGTIWGCKAVGREMVRRKRGCIVNVSSLLASKAGYGNAVYAASKAGVLGLTRSMAAELGPSNVRVNAVVPGYIETDMTQAMTSQARSQALNAIPAGRFGSPNEVADAVMFLATNPYANNCVLNLDGGLSAT